MLLKLAKIYYTNNRIIYGDHMKMRYKLSLLVIALLLAFSMTVGTSYAFWTTTIYQKGTNEVVAGCLEIEVNDLSIEGASTSINLTNAYPISDSKGLVSKPYTLTIKNTCSLNAKYTILLNSLSSSDLNEAHVKYHIIKTLPTYTTMTPLMLNSAKHTTLDTSIASELSDTGVLNTYVIGEGILNAEADTIVDSVTYELRLWIDEAVDNEVMGHTFEAAIAVYAEPIK